VKRCLIYRWIRLWVQVARTAIQLEREIRPYR
jgi:hypothetical protein